MEQLANMEGSGLIPLLADSKYEDLSRMYSLFRRVEGGLDLLRKMMGDHITAQGLALVTDPEKVCVYPPLCVCVGGGNTAHGCCCRMGLEAADGLRRIVA